MKKIILDTDLGGDCDDAAAIALLNKFHNAGLVNVECMLYSNSLKKGARLTDAINEYYGNSFEIGILKQNELHVTYGVPFAERVLDCLGKNDEKDYADANELLYKKLKNALNGSVTVICIGQLRNIANFLKCDFGEVSGQALFNEKVEKLVIMGGNFAQTEEYFSFCGAKMPGEYNFITDLSSVFTVIERAKVPTYYSDFTVGLDVLTLGALSERCDRKNPVSLCYKLFQNGPRYSWDPLTTLFGVFGENDYFSTKRGLVFVDKNGWSTFEECKNANSYVVSLKKSNKETVNWIHSFFEEEIK